MSTKNIFPKIVLFYLYFPLRTFVVLILLSLFKVDSLPGVYAQTISTILSIFFVFIVFQLYKKSEFVFLFKRGFKLWYLPVFILIAFFVRLPILPLVLGLLNGNSKAIVDSQWPSMSASQGLAVWFEYITLFINVVLLGPIFEEIFFRGVILNYLRNKYLIWISILICSLLFALIHGNILLVVSTFIPSLLFSYVYYKTNDLKYPILLHSLVNLFPFIYPYIFLLLR